MLETVRNSFIIITVIAVTVCAAYYLAAYTDYRKGLLHKAGNLLLYVYLKFCVTTAYGADYLALKMESIFKNCRMNDLKRQEINQKEQRMNRIMGQIKTSGSAGKTAYNLKILK